MKKGGILVVLVVSVLLSGTAHGITYGEPDGNRHPNVGALLAEFEPGVKETLCSGTLISARVVLTAAHCIAILESRGIEDVWVSFDTDLTQPYTAYHGTMHTNPRYEQRQSDPGDIAVVVLDEAPSGITPAALPPAGRFDRKPSQLKGQRFTAVGYGATEPARGGGAPSFSDPRRRLMSISTFAALNKAWLKLSQNPAKGDGGTCYGDSGGPNFLGAGNGETSMLAGITITGDSMCRATNVIYRLDTKPARDFLDDFVAVP